MSDILRFAVFMAASAAVFLALLIFVTRQRAVKPSAFSLFLLTFVVVFCGMMFARYSHIYVRPPWWIYYGVPALLTFLLPPLALRMSRMEAVCFVPLAFLMAPVIHIAFSFFVGWHDYMPFPVNIPSMAELFW
jgi:hypothetical protein